MKLIHSIVLSLIVAIHTASASAERPNFVFFIIDDAYREMLNYATEGKGCLLYTSPSPRDVEESRMPSSA